MPMHRRTFFLGSLTAAASARVMGANSRLGIAIVGPGAMGMGHLRTFAREAPALNAEMRVVCDLWNRRREAAAASVKQASGREPRQLQHLEDVLGMKDVDGVDGSSWRRPITSTPAS